MLFINLMSNIRVKIALGKAFNPNDYFLFIITSTVEGISPKLMTPNTGF